LRAPWIAALFCCIATNAAADGVNPGKVYTGPEGLTVAIVPLKSGGKALIEITGAGSELDGKALLHDVEDHNDRVDYRTQIRGRDYVTVYRRGARIEVALPNKRDGVAISYNEEKSKTLNSDGIWQRYQQQTKDGSLAALQHFDRKKEQAQQEKSLAEVADKFRSACGSKATVSVAWNTVDDETLKSLSIASYCGAPAEAMRSLCASNAAKEAIARVRSVTCQFGSGLKVDVSTTGAFTWTASKDGSNFESTITSWLEDHLIPIAPNGPLAPELPWGAGQTLGERMRLEKTRVCSDGKSHFTVIAPNAKSGNNVLYYGDGKKFVAVPPPPWAIGGESFLDPRYFRKGSNPDFRGVDMRVYSGIELSDEKKRCTLRCGENEHDQQILPAAEVRTMLLASSFGPSLQKYRPYALLRDDHGNYYFVDHGSTPETEKSFRLFLGPKGALKLQKMTNVVSDSEGDVFSTKTGSLRLIIDKTAPGTWMKGSARTQLKPVPVEQNLTMIYNELGVYLGEKLGTPCDDF
jgi:hypothetical protein